MKAEYSPALADITFIITIGEYEFRFERLEINNEGLFYICTNMPNERTFFMSKTRSGNWIILYHILLGKELLKLEPQLINAIRERGY